MDGNDDEPVLRLRWHAERRAQRRKITAAEILDVIREPHTSMPSAADGGELRTVLFGVSGTGRRLKVVVLADDHFVVVTLADRDVEE